jgi:SAM-dependent methyltransferase
MAKKKSRGRFTAATADRHVLYGLAVQNVESEIDFIDDTYKELRGARATRLREDFCGTANTSCEWVRRRGTNVAVGLDLCTETLEWGREHNLGTLSPIQRKRISLLHRDVQHPGRGANEMDCILAMNFSYWIFSRRAQMLEYFKTVRTSLATGGIFYLDHYGGYESQQEMVEKRDLDGFTYVWDQDEYNPITGEMTCHIHFHFPDGSKMKKAFTYTWRLWGLAEIRDVLEDAGFARTTVHWEGADDDGEGNGVFEATEQGDADPSYIAYIVAEK